MTSREKILEIAKEARIWAEKTAFQLKMQNNLLGMCARASIYLTDKLSSNNIYSKIALCMDGHVFLIVEDHILDITATQFGEDKIVFLPFKSPHINKWYWNIDLEYDNTDDLINKLIDWPPDQNPSYDVESLTQEIYAFNNDFVDTNDDDAIEFSEYDRNFVE